jgi:hypothetical protein
MNASSWVKLAVFAAFLGIIIWRLGRNLLWK